ncbi:MAG: CBS domain-containing protein [Vicinamibacterales bacterium]
MTPVVVTVTDDMSTNDLVRRLVEQEISGAPVVDGQGHLVGVVSMTDVLRRISDEHAAALGSGFYDVDPADLTLEDLGQRYVEQQAVTVREIMSPVIHSIEETALVADVARLMLDQHIHRLVVMRGSDAVGVVSSLDLLKLIADRR